MKKFWKKALATAVVVSLFVLPLSSMAVAGADETSAGQEQSFVPGGVPAQSSAADSMTSALHAVVLALISRDAQAFDPSDTALAWESLYNMLSLYGQLDERSYQEQDTLLLPSETVRDYAAALDVNLDALGSAPAALSDRLVYHSGSDSYQIACGSDDLAQLRIQSVSSARGSLLLEGALVYLVDGSHLAQFQAVLQPRDNMFGYAIVSLTLA